MALGLLIPARSSRAYEEDTHFLITYVICRTSGFTPAEALTVAAVDQGMDDSPGTVANGGPLGGIIPNVPEEWLWHALDHDGKMGPKGVIKRKDELFRLALTRNTTEDKLLCLGAYFHYQQDTWAHRHHYDGKPHTMDQYTTYNTPVGHALDGHQPDRPPFDPICASLDLQDGLYAARRYLVEGLHRQPNAFFDGYRNFGGLTHTDHWKDKRQGKYFHMLEWKGSPTPTQQFMLNLICAQIGAYTVSTDMNPNFFLRETADQADFEKVRRALQHVCNTTNGLGLEVTVPSQQDKVQQGYNTLTTKRLLDIMK